MNASEFRMTPDTMETRSSEIESISSEFDQVVNQRLTRLVEENLKGEWTGESANDFYTFFEEEKKDINRMITNLQEVAKYLKTLAQNVREFDQGSKISMS